MTKSKGAEGRARYLRPTVAAAALGVTAETLRDWADAGLIQSIKLPSGHRRYSVAMIDSLTEPYVPARAEEPVA